MHTVEEIRALFQADGTSVASWARSNGFAPPLVYRVLRGETQCLRGQTHQIAVALGLKARASADQKEKLRQLKAADLHGKEHQKMR